MYYRYLFFIKILLWGCIFFLLSVFLSSSGEALPFSIGKKNNTKSENYKKKLILDINLDIVLQNTKDKKKSSIFAKKTKNIPRTNFAIDKESENSSNKTQHQIKEADMFRVRITNQSEISLEELNELNESIEKIKDYVEKTSTEFSNAGQIAYWDNEVSIMISKLMHSKGYYAVIIKTDPEINEAEKIYKLSFFIYSRNRYKLDSITITHTEDSNKNAILPNIYQLESKIGDYADARKILQDQEYILTELEDKNCLLSLEVGHEATLNHQTHKISINYLIKAGPETTIKTVSYEGLLHLNPEYLKKLIPIKEGDCFKTSNIIYAKKILQTTGLFYSIKVDTPDTPDKNNQIPVIFRLKERKRRSTKLGLSYGKDLGLGLNFGWENRNLFANAEELNFSSFINQKEQIIDLEFTKPLFFRKDQKFKSSVSAANTSQKAFKSRELKTFVGVTREYSELLSFGVGGKLSNSWVKEAAGNVDTFLLLSTPLSVSYDKRDDIINSRKGYIIKNTLEPFKDLKRKESTFFKNTFSTKYYLPIISSEKHNSVLASKFLVGSVYGNKSASIPVNERFYAGGASSVRGYGFQLAGPLLIPGTKTPKGGNSMLEASLEYRHNFNKNYGIACFVDSGNVYETVTPKFKEKLFYAAGFGVRYNTDFGPIRADIAFPKTRRKDVDSTFQFYFGIGQSF